MRVDQKSVLVVVDPQRAFVDPVGSLANTFGISELQPNIEALARLHQYLANRSSKEPTIFVGSEYTPGQFTEGRLEHPMANLCVPGKGVDCEWASGIEIRSSDHVVTKHQVDAWESEMFRVAIKQTVAEGARRIDFAGFQFTTCVATTAMSTWQVVQELGVSVAVLDRLTGARASSYHPNTFGYSRMGMTRQRLAAAGVAIDNETA